MSAIRLSRAALRARSAVALKPIQRRGYADAVSDKIQLSLALPHQVCLLQAGFLPIARSRRDELVAVKFECVLTTFSVYRLSTSRPMCTLPLP